MLKLICTEFQKLHRRRKVLFMLLASLIMPIISLVYFCTHRDVLTDIGLYKQAIFSFNVFLILPALLGILSATIAYNERANDVLKQLWIIPIKKGSFLVSKWFVTLVFSLAFMIVSILFTVSMGLFLNLLSFDVQLIGFVFLTGVKAAVILSISNLPILAAALVSKGYLAPCCLSIIYAFLGFIFASISPYIIPSASAIIYISHDLPDVIFPHPYEPVSVIMCFTVWALLSIIFALKGMERE